MRLHGTMLDEARDAPRLWSVRDAALQVLIYRDPDDWASIAEIHAEVERLLGRKCREDSPRRMLSYAKYDESSPWTIESKPNPDQPGTCLYRAMPRQPTGQREMFDA